MTGSSTDIAPIIDGAAELLAAYEVVFCDVWGVLHNGVEPYAEAGEALARFRAQGGTVILVSNSPASSSSLAKLLDRVGVCRDAWDAAITSGDLTRTHITTRGYRLIHHIGPEHDQRVFRGLDISPVTLDRATAIVCTGIVNDQCETGESYRPLLSQALARQIHFVCGNPDLVVDVGGKLLPCAGSVATIYESMGGDVYWAGKPHEPAYEAARGLAHEIRSRSVDKGRILAIGDAVRTDLAGAADYGIDCLLVAHGIHRDELMPAGRLDPVRLEALLRTSPHRPVASMPALAW